MGARETVSSPGAFPLAGPRDESMPESFDIHAEVRYSDALLASLACFRSRAPLVLWTYASALAGSLVGSWLVGGVFAWLFPALAIFGAGTVALVAGLIRRDFRNAGGRPRHMRFHVCESGVEIRAAGRGDWVTWEDLWEVGETGRSFFFSPSPGELYVIPKRCCDATTVAGLRETVRGARGPATRP
ncbi:MAG: YcxB family protein [Bryobacterales bacterium]|nr:YcxB family protein [Bryobacterales bacterium]